MKVIILAAGMGSRFDDSPFHLPKVLTPLQDQTSILAYQLQALNAYVSLDQVWIVVGYQKEVIMTAFPNLVYVYNANFYQENTSKSLLRALKKIDEDVLWLNGDVVFHPKILEGLLQRYRTAMVVNRASVGDEEVKYREDSSGKILELSKSVFHAQGEALGINFFKREDLNWLKQNLQRCQATDFFEKAIEIGIKQGQTVWTFPIAEEDCIEIDFPKDLIRAKKLINQW